MNTAEPGAKPRSAAARGDRAVLVGAASVVLAFAVSHAYYHGRGIRLDVSTIPWFDQLLDPILLQTKLLESVWHMHSQPPLFNLLTGAALKLSPDAPQLLLAPVFLAAGLYTGVCLYLLMVRLRLPVAISALLASIAVSSPPFVLHENWYFYPHLNVAWLLGALAWLAQSRGRPGTKMTVAATHWAGLSLTRSLFHPLYFALVSLVVVARVAPGTRRKAALCFLVPGLVLAAWCAKNQVYFGFFGTSSWGSRNVSHAVETLVGENRVRAEDRLGHLSPSVHMGPFESGTRNVVAFRLSPHTTGVTALDEVQKQVQSWHSTSYNHWSYPASARFYAADARDLIEAYPAAYLRGVRSLALPNFLRPVDDDGFLSPNREMIGGLARAFDAVDGSPAFDVVLLIGLGFAFLACLGTATPRGERVALSAALLTIAWVVGVGLVGELGENNRFRFKIVWLCWAIAAAGYAGFARALVVFVREWLPRRRELPHFMKSNLREKQRLIFGGASGAGQ